MACKIYKFSDDMMLGVIIGPWPSRRGFALYFDAFFEVLEILNGSACLYSRLIKMH